MNWLLWPGFLVSAFQKHSAKESASDYPDFPSLDLLFDITRERVVGQLGQVSALDTKANFIIGSATALVSAALVLQTVLPPMHSLWSLEKFLKSLPLLFLLVLYLFLIFCAFIAYKVRDYRGVAKPEMLYEKYIFKPETTTKAYVFKTMVEAYKHNERLIKEKAFWVKCSFWILEFEVLVLVLFVVVQIVS